MSDDVSMIFFCSGRLDLPGARRALAARGLKVTDRGDAVLVRWGAGPELRVSLSRGARVQQEAAEIG